MLDKARYVVVEGPIGAGKTSLARRLAAELQAGTMFEEAEKNPFLGRFYQNPERWAMPTQLSFYLQRIEQLAAHARSVGEDAERKVVADFIIDKDRLFADLNLSGDELALYDRITNGLARPELPKPDLVIYLQAKPETLMERIRRRGMESERRITESYLEDVAERYTRFFYDYDAAPLFVVDAGVLNPVDHDDDFALLLERLRNMRGYREFFAFAG